ncbi:UNVERIFIED_CONTAM: hypothetical protein Slati_3205600 [Sesamum latifolium]|uniref:Uncharacterized protein n=1 Tax=Sesamum latifolium TaxID=2727402 RepID=A0AAW2UXN9_9LAMI
MQLNCSLAFKGSQEVSHLASANDVLIFTNSKETSLETVMNFLHDFERTKNEYFDPVIEAMAQRIGGWEKKFLSYGGRLQMIKSVLLSMPIHILEVLKAPKGVLVRIERMLNKFFWGLSDETSLAEIIHLSLSHHERVHYYWKDGQWDIEKLRCVLPEAVVLMVAEIPFDLEAVDRPWWKGDRTGVFFCKVCVGNAPG